MIRYLLWDFDGTIAYREGMWSAALSEALRSILPDSDVEIGSIRQELSNGFPWHDWNSPWLAEVQPEEWWIRMQRLFSGVFRKVGLSGEIADQASAKVRDIYTNPDSFKVYGDTCSVLNACRNAGYFSYIVSNHVPELSNIVNGIGLEKYFVSTFTSALIGYCKPHVAIYEYVLKSIGATPDQCLMIGDNPIADYEAPLGLGIKSLLVRSNGTGLTAINELIEL